MYPVEPVQMNIYLSNTYQKDLNWLLFDNEPTFQERQQKKDQRSCILIFVAYLTILTINYEQLAQTCQQYSMHGHFVQGSLRRKKLHRTNQVSNFLGDNFSNRDNARTPS